MNDSLLKWVATYWLSDVTYWKKHWKNTTTDEEVFLQIFTFENLLQLLLHVAKMSILSGNMKRMYHESFYRIQSLN